MVQEAKILIVDDTPANITSLKAVLQRVDVTIDAVTSGEDALRALIYSQDYALILLDVRMVGLDGVETAQLIRNNSDTAKIPIIFITADSPSDSMEFEAYETGAIDYIYKPFNPAIVCHKVKVFVELHRKTKEILRAKQEAEEAKEAMAHFLQIMAHDLRAPLYTVLSYAELAVENLLETNGDQQAVRDINNVIFSANTLINITDDFLDVEKMASGDTSTNPESFQVRELTEKLTTILEPLVGRNRNKLVIEDNSDGSPTVADIKKTSRLLTNLVSNAAKFTKGGTITIGVEDKTVDGVAYIQFQVRDSGIGMTQKQLDRIFEKFSQADASTYTKYGGTGLGLAIVKEFTELQRGRLSAASTPGEGTCFTVELPKKVESNLKKAV